MQARSQLMLLGGAIQFLGGGAGTSGHVAKISEAGFTGCELWQLVFVASGRGLGCVRRPPDPRGSRGLAAPPGPPGVSGACGAPRTPGSQAHKASKK